MDPVIGQRLDITMQPEQTKGALAVIFPMIASRLKEAHNIADAAATCAATGNHEGAFRIMLDIEQLTHEADTLLNAACVLRRESKT